MEAELWTYVSSKGFIPGLFFGFLIGVSVVISLIKPIANLLSSLKPIDPPINRASRSSDLYVPDPKESKDDGIQN